MTRIPEKYQCDRCKADFLENQFKGQLLITAKNGGKTYSEVCNDCIGEVMELMMGATINNSKQANA